jgi:Fic-DOC domain mobile mystery protein B
MINFVYPFGATPLDLDECQGLLPKHITMQAELNEWEQANILEAEKWFSQQNLNIFDLLNFSFITRLHQKMFDRTWNWAGQFRKSNKNIGTDWHNIAEQLKLLLDDVQYQIKSNTYSIDEIAARFHHRLVSIHLFPNGNGRHSRLMSDYLLISLDKTRFSWGQKSLDLFRPSEIRKEYINALRAADLHNYNALFAFVRK